MGNGTQQHLSFAERIVKGHYFLKLEEAIQKQPDPFGRGEQLHLTGSAAVYLMRKHGLIRDIIPKIPNDADIGIYSDRPELQMPDSAHRHLLQVVLGAAEELGMQAVDTETGRKVLTHGSQPLQFQLQFEVSGHEVAAIIGKRPDVVLEDLPATMPLSLDIQLMPYHNAMLNPTARAPGHAEDGGVVLHYGDMRDSLAVKIVRGLAPERQNPHDLVDMYNIVTATPALVDMQADRDLLRVLAVCTMACRGVTEQEINLDRYVPDREHLDEVRNTIKIYGERVTLNDRFARMLIEKAGEITEAVFPKPENGAGILLEQEREFIRGILEPESRRVTLNIHVELLQEAYPETFRKHPELERNILHNTFIQDKVRVRGEDVFSPGLM